LVDKLEHNGQIKLGHNVSIGYYAQNQAEMLDLNKTVFNTLNDVAVGEMQAKVRNILGSFLFSGDDIDKKVSVLSGGEKARLALAKLLLSPVNLLVLDEPTNHLDIRSKDILKEALKKYNGTLIIVSHDRDFLHNLTTKLYEFKNKNIKEFIGDVTEFLKYKKLASFTELETLNNSNKNNNNGKENLSQAKIYREEKKQIEREQKKIQKQIEECEKDIELIEKKLKEIDFILINPIGNEESIVNGTIYKEYEALKNRLHKEMTKWEELQKSII
jgi:ATP-binding cassette subfamily F protein 3